MFVSNQISFVSDWIRNCVDFRGVVSTGTRNEDFPGEHLRRKDSVGSPLPTAGMTRNGGRKTTTETCHRGVSTKHLDLSLPTTTGMKMGRGTAGMTTGRVNPDIFHRDSIGFFFCSNRSVSSMVRENPRGDGSPPPFAGMTIGKDHSRHPSSGTHLFCL